MYNAGPFALVGQNIEYVFAMIESTSKKIIPNTSWMGGNGMTRENFPQTSLVLESGATIHFLSNQNLPQSFNATKLMKIHCGGKAFDPAMIGRICDKLKYLSLSKGNVCIVKDGIANLLSMGKMVKEGY